MDVFFFGVPCLVGILPDLYLNHFALFVTSIYVLSSDFISEADLIKCQDWLVEFVEQFEILYGPSQMFHNVHLLLHLVACVRNNEPLFCYDLFGFESVNGMLLKLVSGTRGVSTQISRKYTAIRFLPKLLSSVQVTDNVEEFCDDILFLVKRCKEVQKLVGVTLLGESCDEPLTEEESELFEGANLPKDSACYERMIFKRVKYHSEMCKRQGKKTFDGGVLLKDQTYGVIRRILVVRHQVVLVIRSINIEQNMCIVTAVGPNAARVPHIKVCDLYPYGDLRLVNATEACAKCIVMTTDMGTYASVLPNNFEKD